MNAGDGGRRRILGCSSRLSYQFNPLIKRPDAFNISERFHAGFLTKFRRKIFDAIFGANKRNILGSLLQNADDGGDERAAVTTTRHRHSLSREAEEEGEKGRVASKPMKRPMKEVLLLPRRPDIPAPGPGVPLKYYLLSTFGTRADEFYTTRSSFRVRDPFFRFYRLLERQKKKKK
ncbi:hypothetical protein PUN28_013392 [Cardiocondyla obscurior]|uniref:Uncharacterized protein n=1 Tax=Cardiocondyla obscurior TaxID=286306 RepID=A0AAW2FAN4_9HYME